MKLETSKERQIASQIVSPDVRSGLLVMTNNRSKGPRDELCLRVFTESRHILRDNPALRKLEEMGQKDQDYKTMIEFV